MRTRRGGVVLALVTGVAASGVAHAALWDRGGGLLYDDVLNVTWLQDANYARSELSNARVNEIVAAVNAASPSWLGGHVMSASDFEMPGVSYTGYMTWWGAMAWADQLQYGGLADWRLPVMVFPGTGSFSFSNNGTATAGYGATGSGYGTPTPTGGWGPAGDPDGLWSELGWMYYHNLGNRGLPVAGGGLTSTSTPDGVTIANLRSDNWYWSGTEYAADPSNAWDFGMGIGYQGPIAKASQSGGIDIYTDLAWAVRPGDVPLPGAGLLLASALTGLAWVRRRR